MSIVPQILRALGSKKNTNRNRVKVDRFQEPLIVQRAGEPGSHLRLVYCIRCDDHLAYIKVDQDKGSVISVNYCRPTHFNRVAIA
jgi:hypothetical protein